MKQNLKTIVVGAGRVGSNIAKKLSRENDDVILIDILKDELESVTDFTGFMEVGDATDLAFMEEMGIKTADRVVVFTDDDNTNIFLSDICSQIYNVPHIYIRLKDSRKMKIVSKDVTCICPFDLSLEDFNKQQEEQEA